MPDQELLEIWEEGKEDTVHREWYQPLPGETLTQLCNRVRRLYGEQFRVGPA